MAAALACLVLTLGQPIIMAEETFAITLIRASPSVRQQDQGLKAGTILMELCLGIWLVRLVPVLKPVNTSMTQTGSVALV